MPHCAAACLLTRAFLFVTTYTSSVARNEASSFTVYIWDTSYWSVCVWKFHLVKKRSGVVVWKNVSSGYPNKFKWRIHRGEDAHLLVRFVPYFWNPWSAAIASNAYDMHNVKVVTVYHAHFRCYHSSFLVRNLSAKFWWDPPHRALKYYEVTCSLIYAVLLHSSNTIGYAASK